MKEFEFQGVISRAGFQLDHLSVGSVCFLEGRQRTCRTTYFFSDATLSLSATIHTQCWNGRGDGMPRYISQHTLACLTRQGAEKLSSRLQVEGPVSARRVLVNMHEGKMLVEFDAPGREELEKWLQTEKFHFDWLLRIELESAGRAPLAPA
jgi:hypothetical protein